MTTEPMPPQRSAGPPGQPQSTPNLDMISPEEFSALSEEELMETFGTEESITPLSITGYEFAYTTPDDDPNNMAICFFTDISAQAYFQPDDDFLRTCGRIYYERQKRAKGA